MTRTSTLQDSGLHPGFSIKSFNWKLFQLFNKYGLKGDRVGDARKWIDLWFCAHV